MLCTNLVVTQLYTDVQLLNSLFAKGLRKGFIVYVASENIQRIRTAKEGSGYKQ